MPNIRQVNKNSKFPYKPDAGVKTDFETILERFAECGTVRYETFAKIWKDLKMHLYCAGRQNQREAREFMEDCFKIAVQFCVPPSSFLVRVGSIYLLYGLYHFQLVNPKVKIQITPEIWDILQMFMSEIREQQHLDLEYIFQSLVVDRAFIFAATTIWCYPTFKDAVDSNLISENLKETCNAVDEIFSSSCLNQLALIHDQYHKMKVVLNGEESTKPDSSLDIIHQDLIHGVYKTLSLHRERQTSIVQGVSSYKAKASLELAMGESTSDDETKISKKRSLKKKAFKTFKGYKMKAGEQDTKKAKPSKKQSTKMTYKTSKAKSTSTSNAFYEKVDFDIKAEVSAEMMKEVLNIPDEDVIVYKSADTSASEDEASKDKGKKPLKGKEKKKSTKNSTTTDTESDTNTQTDIQHDKHDSMSDENGTKRRPGKVEIDLLSDSDISESPIKKRKLSKNVKSDIGSDSDRSRSPRKKGKIAQDVEADFGSDSDKMGSPGRSTSAKSVGCDTVSDSGGSPNKKRKTGKRASVIIDTDDDDNDVNKKGKTQKVTVKQEQIDFDLASPEQQKRIEKQKKTKVSGKKDKHEKEEKSKEPTAQEKLNQKLMQRVKTSREKNKNKKKKS